MPLLVNLLSVSIFIFLILFAFKLIKKTHVSEKDWLSTGLFCSLYLELFTAILGAVSGVVAVAIPQASQKNIWIVLIPLVKFSFFGSSAGLVFFFLLIAIRDVTADVKARIKKYREKKLNQR